jgi:hypothetical protein
MACWWLTTSLVSVLILYAQTMVLLGRRYMPAAVPLSSMYGASTALLHVECCSSVPLLSLY